MPIHTSQIISFGNFSIRDFLWWRIFVPEFLRFFYGCSEFFSLAEFEGFGLCNLSGRITFCASFETFVSFPAKFVFVDEIDDLVKLLRRLRWKTFNLYSLGQILKFVSKGLFLFFVILGFLSLNNELFLVEDLTWSKLSKEALDFMALIWLFIILMLDEANHGFIAHRVEFSFVVRSYYVESRLWLFVCWTWELSSCDHLHLKISNKSEAAAQLNMKSLFIKNFPKSINRPSFPSFAIILTGRTLKCANWVIANNLNFPNVVFFEGEFVFWTNNLDWIRHIMGANLLCFIQIHCFICWVNIECPGASNIIYRTALLLAANGLVSLYQQQFVKNS